MEKIKSDDKKKYNLNLKNFKFKKFFLPFLLDLVLSKNIINQLLVYLIYPN